jgi:hypothetical protein
MPVVRHGCREHRLAHEPFRHLQQMAKQGILPKRLANCRVPKCAACYYGKSSKVPWRVKGDPKDGELFQATVAGQVVSVDQPKSTIPDLIGQIKGWLTVQRYHVATIFCRPLQPPQLHLSAEIGYCQRGPHGQASFRRIRPYDGRQGTTIPHQQWPMAASAKTSL